MKLLLTLWWRTVKYFPPSPGGPIPGTRPQNLGRFKTEPVNAPKNRAVNAPKSGLVNALKMEVVAAPKNEGGSTPRKPGWGRAENWARVAARKIADGWVRGVTSVVTRVVNGRCEQPALTLPRAPVGV